MNAKPGPPASTSTRGEHGSSRVPRRWLLLARGGWVAVVVLTLAISFASLPVYIAQLQTPCVGAACANEALLTPELADVLKGVGLDLRTYAAYTVAFTLVSIVVCLGVSVVIVWHRSDDRMALIVALMLVTLGPIGETTIVLASPSPWQWPSACLSFLSFALLLLVGLLFPSGRFVPRWTSLSLVVFLAVSVSPTFFPNAPFSLNPDALLLYYLLSLGELVIVAAVQFYRYRRVSSPMQRQQTKWVAYGIALYCLVEVVGYGLMFFFPALTEPSSLYPLAFNVVRNFAQLLIPLSFGLAILRSRLWDIDILINRTLVYGTLTLLLTAVYVGLVIGLQALLRGIISQDNSVAIVISTLIIAALFGPLRARIQVLIDRRFYRRKYDAAKTLQAFSAQLSKEVDLRQLSERLMAVVQETMQPASISLWLCQSPQGKRAGTSLSLGIQASPSLEGKQSRETLSDVTHGIEPVRLVRRNPMVKWTQILYLIVAWLFPVAILIQVFFVGLSLFTGQSLWGTHGDFGHTLVVFPLLLIILAYLGRVPRQDKLLVWLQFGVYLVQAEVFAAIRNAVPFLAAFHPVLALVLFALALIVALRAARAVRAEVQASSPLQQRSPVEEEESLMHD
jgi:hypothetical protein